MSVPDAHSPPGSCSSLGEDASRALTVGIDLRILDTPGAERTGLGRYAYEITHGLATARKEWRLGLFTNRSDLFGNLPNAALISTRFPTDRAIGRIAWLHTASALSARHVRPDVWFGPTFTLPIWWRGPAVVMVQDLIFLVLREAYRGRLNAIHASAATRLGVRSADIVIAPSTETAAHLERELNVPSHRIRLIPNGVSQRFFAAADALPGPQDANHFLLFVGTFEARKGLDTLFPALEAVNREGLGVHLKLAGRPGWGTDELLTRMENSALVEVVEDPTDDELASLYAGATAVVYPSRMEGFGLPVAEGMAAGRPVIATDLECIREFARDAPLYVAPGDSQGLAAAIARVVRDPDSLAPAVVRGAHYADRLRWGSVAEETATAIEEARAGR
ncbi:MAG: glycosyltransferase family 1 protein [Solirubrobacteraceae bacterium]